MAQAGASAAAPTRVIILGGGPAGVAAAYWLSAPEQNGKYQVSLYSQGWRLGGKCASGRDARAFDRIEEHGLHMMMGCYQNAFATLRSCYLDWRKVKIDPTNPFQTWTDAFLPQRLITMMEEDGPGSPPSWSPWNFPFPQLPGEPGDGPLVAESGQNDPSNDVVNLLLRLFHWLEDGTPKSAPYRPALVAALRAARTVFVSSSVNATGALQALDKATGQIHGSIASGGAAAVATPQWLSRLAILADFGVAVTKGYFRDLFLKGQAGWAKLNTQDFRAWLGSCGANATTLASGPVNAFYDLAFAAVDGRETGLGGGSIAAGVSLLTQMEIALGYRDAPLFKMAAGMGDTVFTPFYDVLTARGVAINFFSRVTQVTSGADGGIGQIDILTQAVTEGGALYRPFVRVENLDCWPNTPDWCQLVNGRQMEADGVDFESSTCGVSVGPAKPLLAGTDFDIAILAMPPQVLGAVAQQLAAANPAWETALGASRSVATQSLQLWMKPDIAKLGWTFGPTVLTAFEEPLDSWGDMSQVIPRESWPAGQTPGSIAYFCGCMAIPLGLPVGKTLMNAEAVTNATGWMSANLSTLWPDVGPDATAQASVQSRYDVANFDLSDTYVQTPAGTNVASRLNPGAAAGFSNLYVVGDWTRTRFSGGCFESAVESAMLASRAISGFPQAIKTS